MTNRTEEDSIPEVAPLDRKLSKDEINALEISNYKGRIENVYTQVHMLSAVKELRRESLLGFDTETRPAFKKGESYPTALLQLAGGRCVYIFHLNCIQDPAVLFTLLADRKITKSGVAIADDVKELKALSDFEPAGFIDIGNRARECGMKHHGLRGLTALLLGFRISKSFQRYNWGLPKISQKAIVYAATDAWVGRELYLVMKQRGCF